MPDEGGPSLSDSPRPDPAGLDRRNPSPLIVPITETKLDSIGDQAAAGRRAVLP
jgi:hypothetical protein